MTDSTDGTIPQNSNNQWPTVNSTRDSKYISATNTTPLMPTKPKHPKSFYTKKQKRGRKK